MIQSGDDFFILTHDHWTLLNLNLYKVQFHTVENVLLLEVGGEAFQQLIRYRDGGTMVLDAPEELRLNLMATEVGNGRSVQKNDTLLIAYRQPNSNTIGVAAMRVKNLRLYQGRPVYRLSSLSGATIVGGNSGGGVWVDGQLVGNMWTTTMEIEGSWLMGSVGTATSQTNQGLAARLPETVLQ